MPSVVVLTPTSPEQEPVSLALLKQQVRVDSDAEDELLTLLVQAAREQVEAYTGRYFAAQTLELTYELGEDYALPPGATATGVTGFFTNLDALAEATAYLEEYRKGIHISRELTWGSALGQTYTVTAEIPASVNVPGLAKSAMLELAAEWYRNRESSSIGTISPELPVGWRVKLSSLRVNPL